MQCLNLWLDMSIDGKSLTPTNFQQKNGVYHPIKATKLPKSRNYKNYSNTASFEKYLFFGSFRDFEKKNSTTSQPFGYSIYVYDEKKSLIEKKPICVEISSGKFVVFRDLRDAHMVKCFFADFVTSASEEVSPNRE